MEERTGERENWGFIGVGKGIKKEEGRNWGIKGWKIRKESRKKRIETGA